jgi:hypothetical protein
VSIAVSRASDLHFEDGRIVKKHDLQAGGESLTKGSAGGNRVTSGPYYEPVLQALSGDGTIVPLTNSGSYTVNVIREYELYDGSTLLHRCAFDIPVTVRVAEPEHAEQVTLKSGASLDARIKAAVKLTRQAAVETYSTPNGEYEADTVCWIEVEGPPENVAFRCSYRDESGFTRDFADFTVVARRGPSTSGSRFLPRWTSMMNPRELQLETGHYKGVIVLTADEEVAYRDPAMKTIWGGTIEFPIEFEVKRVK